VNVPTTIIDGVTVERDVEMQTRDGAVLRSDVYRPATRGAHPILMLRTPYDKGYAHDATYLHPAWYARQGFIVVVQDVRGRYASEGEFVPFANEGEDGYDAVEWAAALEGSNGRVGMYGASYPGAVQFLAAVERPPHLCAIAPALAATDFYEHFMYEGGALNLAFVAHWCAVLAENMATRASRPELAERLREIISAPTEWLASRAPLELPPLGEIAPFYTDWLRHAQSDGYWEILSASSRLDRIAVPVLHISGWYDTFLENTLSSYRRLQATDAVSPQWLLIGPWAHYPLGIEAGERRFSGDAQGTVAIDRYQLSFFKRFLADESDAFARPSVRVFVLFGGQWSEGEDWPPPGEEFILYLRSGGAANTLGGDGVLSDEAPEGDEQSDIFQYYPAFPVPAVGGHSCCDPSLLPMGCADQTSVEQMVEVLVYTSEPFAQPATFAGPVVAELFVATDAPSADYTAKLCLVDDEGAWNVAEGIRRLRPNDVAGARVDESTVRVTVSLRSVAFEIGAGQRLRLEVSGGTFPTYDRNPQTGAEPATARVEDLQGALHVVFHDAKHPSALRLRRLP
jgi:putative CocE/NonD family hydrolase